MKKIIAVFLSTFLVLCLFMGCGKDPGIEAKRGLNDYSFSMASLSGTDRLGRKVTAMREKKSDKQRYVGVFYWLWAGNHDHQFGVYDNTKLMSTPEGQEALFNVTNPPGEGMENASPMMQFHWTNEPLYGYYNASDPWVIARHIELLTMAGVDFIFLDTTNHAHYARNFSQHTAEASQIKGSGIALLDTMLEYYNQGWDVPKVMFYTNTCSGERVDEIYENYYKSGKYDELWFAPEGKPMIVGTTEKNGGASDMNPEDPSQYSNISAAMQEYFDVKESQWPTTEPQEYGFPWMSWEYPQHYHTETKAVNVSVAQHSSINVCFSSRHKWSNRGYDYHTDTIEEDYTAGRNFENEWETVFEYEAEGKGVEFVTVTGWNEWIVLKQQGDDYATETNPNGMMMVDNFDSEYSRDIEMDKNHYQDNFYMQLVRNVRKFKYSELNETYHWKQTTVDSLSDFADVDIVYKDFAGDARERDFYGYDIRRSSVSSGSLGSWYTDTTNRNDIVETRVAHDKENLYFYVETKEDITAYESGDNWMNILIKTGNSTAEGSFEGYDYIINRSPKGDKTSVERSNGGWNWESSGEAEMMVEGNRMMVTVPLSALGMANGEVQFEFKVADNVSKPSHFTEEDAEHSIMHYYVTGDSAPIGRLNYSYGY